MMAGYNQKLMGVGPLESTSIAQYIRTVARLRNISAAAEELGVTQPALSARIKKLESQLGAAVFDRSTTPLSITEVGRAYLECQEGIEALNRGLSRKITQLKNLEAGHLVIGGATFFNITYLPQAVARFSALYPGVEVKIVDDTVPNLTEAALRGEIDLFITPFASSNTGLVYEEFLDERIFLCLPPQAPELAALPAPGEGGFAILRHEDFAALEDCCFITLGLAQQIGRKMAELFKEHSFTPAKVIQVDQTLTSLALTLAGAGASLITETTLRDLERKPAMFLPEGSICRRSLYVAQPKGEEPSRAVEEFARILREVNAAGATA